MVQLVFIHGVAAPRDAAAYQKIANHRQLFFDKFCFQGTNVTYSNPHWAVHGAPGEEAYKTIPKDKSGTLLAVGDTSLGGAGGEDVGSLAGAKDIGLSGTILTDMAKDDFSGFLNTLAIAAVDGGHDMNEKNIEMAGNIANFLMNRADMSEDGIKDPSWLNAITNDDQLITRLEEEIAFDVKSTGASQNDVTTLGLGNTLKKLGGKIAGGAIDVVDGPIAKKARKLTPKIAVFLGDAFAYIKNVPRRPKIRQVVRSAIIDAAIAAKANDEKLILTGHSMGANILVDMLFDLTAVQEIETLLGFKLKVDLLLTVGTQVGLFEELGLFATSAAGSRQSRPACIDRWWHVYNHMDILAFTVTEVFDGAEQFRVNTKANIFNAHGAYFVSSIFHKRLRKRLINVGLLA